MKAFVEVVEAPIVLLVRVGPDAERYGSDWEFAFLAVGTKDRITIKGLNGQGGTRAHFEAGFAALVPFKFTEVVYERNDHKGPRSFALTLGPSGELKMGKTTNELMRDVHAHDHMHQSQTAATAAGNKVSGNLINQESAGAVIDAMRALHKAGKSEIVEATTGEFITAGGLVGYQTLLRAVPVAD
jgi:hypothetical protein